MVLYTLVVCFCFSSRWFRCACQSLSVGRCVCCGKTCANCYFSYNRLRMRCCIYNSCSHDCVIAPFVSNTRVYMYVLVLDVFDVCLMSDWDCAFHLIWQDWMNTAAVTWPPSQRTATRSPMAHWCSSTYSVRARHEHIMIILDPKSPKLVARKYWKRHTNTFFCVKTVILDGCEEVDVIGLWLRKPNLAFYLRSLPLAQGRINPTRGPRHHQIWGPFLHAVLKLIW